MIVVVSPLPVAGSVLVTARVELLPGLVMGSWKEVLLSGSGARVGVSLGVVSGCVVVPLPETASVIDSWLILVVVAEVVSVRLPGDLAVVSVVSDVVAAVVSAVVAAVVSPVVAAVVPAVVAAVVSGVVAAVVSGVVAAVVLGVVAAVVLGVVAFVVLGLVVGFVVRSELSLESVSRAVALPVVAPLVRPCEVMAGAGVIIIKCTACTSRSTVI